jgi:integrase
MGHRMVITAASTHTGHLQPAADAIRLAGERARHSRADSTRRAYRSDWADFEAACARLGLPCEATAETVAVYIDQLARAGAKVATIRRRIAAINTRLRMAGQPSLSMRDEPLASVFRGIRRDVGAPSVGAKPIEIDQLRAVAGACTPGVAGLRDRALLLLGFAGAFRRSELAGLDWRQDDGDGAGYLVFGSEGLRVVLRRSKTNQAGDFEEVAICRGAFAATCPVAALEAWQRALATADGRSPGGPVFRAVDAHGRAGTARLSGWSVCEIIKRAVARTARVNGADKAEQVSACRGISGHSLRSGLVTTAFGAGLSAEDVMRQTRHRDVTTLLRYRRHATAFVANVSGRVGL